MGPDALISVFVFVAGYVAIAFKGHGRPAGRDGLCLGTNRERFKPIGDDLADRYCFIRSVF